MMSRILKSFSLITAVSILILSPKILFAGPPFFTDDPEPVEYKHGELYTASTFIRDKGGASGTLPHVEFNYGAWHELQLHVIAPFAFNHDKGMETTYGYGDTELGAKYRFIQETNWIPQVGTFPLIELPTGNNERSLGTGKTQLFLPLWLQKSWGPWTTYGGGGYWFNPGTGNKDWVYTGWLLQRDLTKWVTLGGEIFYRTPDKIDGQSGIGLNGGGQVNFTSNHHLLFSAGTDVYGPRHLTIYMGYQWTF
jgi:hypothetical protein